MIYEKFVKEFTEESNILGIKLNVLEINEGNEYKKMILEKYQPQNTWSHLCIDERNDAGIYEIPVRYEPKYFQCLPNEPLFIFFSQASEGIRHIVFFVENNEKLGDLMNHEYFLSNATGDYLISVNDYVIQYKGEHPEWFDSLIK